MCVAGGRASVQNQSTSEYFYPKQHFWWSLCPRLYRLNEGVHVDIVIVLSSFFWESSGRNSVGGRCLLYLFTCNFPTTFASRPAHVELIDSHSAGCSSSPHPPPLFPSCSHIFCLVAMLLPYLFFLFFFSLYILFFLDTFLCLSVSSCANFSLWLSVILQLLLSLHLPPSLPRFVCLSLVSS